MGVEIIKRDWKLNLLFNIQLLAVKNSLFHTLFICPYCHFFALLPKSYYFCALGVKKLHIFVLKLM